jgi:hypothetical protein
MTDDLTPEERVLVRTLLLQHAAKSRRLADRAAEARGYDDLRGKGPDRSDWLKSRWEKARETALSALGKLA